MINWSNSKIMNGTLHDIRPSNREVFYCGQTKLFWYIYSDLVYVCSKLVYQMLIFLVDFPITGLVNQLFDELLCDSIIRIFNYSIIRHFLYIILSYKLFIRSLNNNSIIRCFRFQVIARNPKALELNSQVYLLV